MAGISPSTMHSEPKKIISHIGNDQGRYAWCALGKKLFIAKQSKRSLSILAIIAGMHHIAWAATTHMPTIKRKEKEMGEIHTPSLRIQKERSSTGTVAIMKNQ